jgi:HD-like signal output (HDOD) protein
MPEALLVGAELVEGNLINAEKHGIENLEQLLAAAPQPWTVRKTAVTDAALTQLEMRPADVLIAELGDDANAYQAFFSEATRIAPRTLRFALFKDASTLPDKVMHAHQILSVRPDMRYAIPILDAAAEVVKQADGHLSLRHIISQLHDVPSPPTLYFDIREQIEGSSGDLAGMAAATAKDPGLVARILKTVNSGFYGLPRSISDLSEAVGLIGTTNLLGMVLAAHLYSGLPPPGLKLELLWQHTLRVSTLAKQIAHAGGASHAEQCESAVAGLLHDIGILVLLENEPARYQPMWRSSGGDEQALAALEKEAFGATHGELGAMILMLWSLPEAVVQAVAHSHSVQRPNDECLPLTSRAVLAAEWLLDTGVDVEVPESLLPLPDDTLVQWHALRDQVAVQSMGF